MTNRRRQLSDKYRYALERLTQPSEEPVSLEQARFNCSIEDSESDEALVQLVRQAREYCEERTDAALMACQWKMVFDRFPVSMAWLTLPRWPLVRVDTLQYVASDGTLATITTDNIVVRKDSHGRGRIALIDWADWPTTRNTPDAVRITFTAGYEAPEDVPSTWQRAMLMLVTWWFEQREAGVLGTIASTAPIGVDDLLAAAAAVDDFDDFDLG
jgi:uncharacterized phiE125 gp8 family phage protein